MKTIFSQWGYYFHNKNYPYYSILENLRITFYNFYCISVLKFLLMGERGGCVCMFNESVQASDIISLSLGWCLPPCFRRGSSDGLLKFLGQTRKPGQCHLPK